jgi:exopolyphosphatase/guanosine-5'-triphosphate,3'-diphosphate pyrophosphatase
MAVVAVIDIGSNSIKALVAKNGATENTIVPLFEETKEVRISAGISGNPPTLGEESIEAGVRAVTSLWKSCQSHGPLAATRIVATAAVRAATNGHAFAKGVEDATGLQPDTLSGEEEADGIAHGVLTDPAIDHSQDAFSVIDLGGGSMELIHFEKGEVTDRRSLPLGSVHISEQFFSDRCEPIPEIEQNALKAHVREQVEQAGVPMISPIIGCSGGLTVLRAMRASEKGSSIEDASPVFTRSYLEAFGNRVISSDHQYRIDELGLPASRADIFPAAFLTFQALLDLSQADCIIHSLHNLRYGLAWRLLQDA